MRAHPPQAGSKKRPELQHRWQFQGRKPPKPPRTEVHVQGVFMQPSPFFKLAFSRSPYYKARSFSLPYGIASFPSAIPQARLSHPRLLSPRNFPSAAQMKGCAGFPPRVRGAADSPIRCPASLIGPRLPIRGPVAAQGFPFAAAICVFGPVRPCERTSTHAIAQARCRQRTSA